MILIYKMSEKNDAGFVGPIIHLWSITYMFNLNLFNLKWDNKMFRFEKQRIFNVFFSYTDFQLSKLLLNNLFWID